MSLNLKFILIKAQLICIFIYLSFLSIRIHNGAFDDDQTAFRILIAVIFSYILNLIQQKITFRGLKYFSFSFLFPLAFFIVYFQIAALHLFGFSVLSRFEWFIWAGSNNISKTISVAALGIVGYFIGIAWRPSKILPKRYELEHPKSLLQIITYLSYFFYILFLLNAGSYIFGAYIADGTFLASYSAKLFNICLFSGLSINIYQILNSNKRYKSILSYLNAFYSPLLALAFFNILMSIFVGDRGPIISYLIIIFSAYFLKSYQLGFVKLALILVISSAFLTILGEARTRVIGESFVERFVSATETEGPEYFDEGVPVGSLVELALSVRTLAVSVESVPKEFDYHYGGFQLQQIAAVVPGAQGLVNRVVYGGDPKYDGSANFITYLIHRRPVDYGDGSSIMADLYLDFGLAGAIILMFVFGRFISRIEIDIHRGNIRFGFRFIIFMTFLSNAIYLSRSTIMLEFSGIVFCYLLIKIVMSILSKSKKNTP